jgi:hypothetical protein
VRAILTIFPFVRTTPTKDGGLFQTLAFQAVNMTNPQTWNQYAYVNNVPTIATDPLGLWCFPNIPHFCDVLGTYGQGQFGFNWDMMAVLAIAAKEVDVPGPWQAISITDTGQVEEIQGTVATYPNAWLVGFAIQTLASQPTNGWRPGPDLVAMGARMRSSVVATLQQARPTVCGGGVFGYYGKGVTALGVKGFTGVIGEADSRSGITGGSLNEFGAFGVGGGSIVGSGGVTGLGFAELGEIPGVGSAGGVAFGGTDGGGIGGYGEGEFLGREAGGGAYLNVTPVSECQ